MGSLTGDEFAEAAWIRRRKHAGMASVFSVHLGPLERTLRTLRDSGELGDESGGAIHVGAPRPCGPFWVDRFTQLHGFRADIAV
jgi:hypothetical protein